MGTMATVCDFIESNPSGLYLLTLTLTRIINLTQTLTLTNSNPNPSPNPNPPFYKIPYLSLSLPITQPLSPHYPTPFSPLPNPSLPPWFVAAEAKANEAKVVPEGTLRYSNPLKWSKSSTRRNSEGASRSCFGWFPRLRKNNKMLFGCLINLPCCYTRCVVVCCVSNGMKKYIHEAITI